MQQRGFTLIELIIVIVILGILAVTAAPRFLDLSEDARTSTMQGVVGAVRSSSQIAHAALLVRPTASVDAEGVVIQANDDGGDFTGAGNVEAVNSYPHAEDICDLIGLTTDGSTAGALGADDANDTLSCDMDGTTDTVLIQDDAATTPANCSVTYVEATGANTQPTITLVTAGC